jgi:DNA primase catalytic subunit
LILPGFGSTSSRPLIPAYVQQRLPPGVRLGNVTALNTDQHRFYSFNQRLLSRFIPLWGDRVRSALYQWIKENNSPSVSKTWVTNVEVIMNEKGEVLDVQPFRLSGLWSIDEASINSFKDVRNVPNPPSEMVDENGYIHLQFQTEVLWIPQPGVRFTGDN